MQWCAVRLRLTLPWSRWAGESWWDGFYTIETDIVECNLIVTNWYVIRHVQAFALPLALLPVVMCTLNNTQLLAVFVDGM